MSGLGIFNEFAKELRVFNLGIFEDSDSMHQALLFSATLKSPFSTIKQEKVVC